MDKFIKELLLKFSKVILPGFGAIVYEDEESGELMFNEHLSYDDGKLVKKLVEESNMDEQEATNALAKFIRELQHHLNKGETYSIFQLGEFRKSEDGEYLFLGNAKTGVVTEPEETTIINPVVTTELKEAIDKKIDEVKEKVEEANQKIDEVIDSTSSSVVAMFAQGEKKKEEVKKKVEEEVKKVIPVEEPKVEAPKVEEVVEKKASKDDTKKNVYVPKDEVTEKEKTVVPPVIEEPIKKEVEPEKKKRSAFFWFLIVLLALVGVAAVYGAFNYDKIEEFMGWKDIVTVEDVKEAQEEIVEEEAELIDEASEEMEDAFDDMEDVTEDFEEIVEDVVEDVVEEVVEEVIPVTSSSGNYHIIVGGFGDPANADKLVNDLRAKGLDAKVISGSGSLTQVSAQSYSTMQEAQQNLSTIKDKTGVSGWILKQ